MESSNRGKFATNLGNSFLNYLGFGIPETIAFWDNWIRTGNPQTYSETSPNWIAKYSSDMTDKQFNDWLISRAREESGNNEFIGGMSDEDLLALLSDGYLPGARTWNDTQFKKDLAELNSLQLPDEPSAVAYRKQAEADVTKELNNLLDYNKGVFEQGVRNNVGSYNEARQGLLSQQYLNNARLNDTLNSNMDRARRTALASGASAGLRIANNVNTLLSNQNQQASTAMNTSNQLAGMLLNTQQANSSLRRSYTDTVNSLNNSKDSRIQARYENEYGAALKDYESAETAARGVSNPLNDAYWANKSAKDKVSKYTSTQSGNGNYN